jgi:hypothetical protein
VFFQSAALPARAFRANLAGFARKISTLHGWVGRLPAAMVGLNVIHLSTGVGMLAGEDATTVSPEGAPGAASSNWGASVP